MAEPEPPVSSYDEFFVSDKDPNYVYKWCNSRDRVMTQRFRQGYEVVTEPERVPEAMKAYMALQQPPTLASPEPNPAGGLRKRGDLILMKIRKDVHERNVRGPISAARERHAASLDTMVQQAHEQAVRALRKAGYAGGQLRPAMAFQDTPEPFKQ